MEYKDDQLELFGNETQVKLQRRYFRLWPYLRAHPRLSFVGRGIGIDGPADDEVENLAGLTKELGFLALGFTPALIVDKLKADLEGFGLKVGTWQLLMSNERTEESCRSIVASISLPAGYYIERISAATPPQKLRRFQKLMQECGVAPLPGYILRSRSIPTLAKMVIGSRDEVLATGVGIFRHNPDGFYGKAAHVGFLATAPRQRGKGFARLLLARTILACYVEYEAEFVYTGVRADNIPSQRVCRSCGLEDSGTYFLGVANPQIVEQAEFTR